MCRKGHPVKLRPLEIEQIRLTRGDSIVFLRIVKPLTLHSSWQVFSHLN
ncbi:BQ5605_C017g08533 [Microbotryum silenes-dioicae]|uniref:BQ5605_C017g08533 protein n=1 Tax=Microbotryum silenes-dioicae TaxID=796604 RepID=A0A2X0NZ56_9BASI|nr:BQ5605_C017g08533 [Microbotryum silenes-dioicae]